MFLFFGFRYFSFDQLLGEMATLFQCFIIKFLLAALQNDF